MNPYIFENAPVLLRYASDWEGGSPFGGFAYWIQDCNIRHHLNCNNQYNIVRTLCDTMISCINESKNIKI